jgi:hypothetical protein
VSHISHHGRVKVSVARGFRLLLQAAPPHSRNCSANYGVYRQELVAWLNNLLQLNITKVEQCGTGYVTRAAPDIAGS